MKAKTLKKGLGIALSMAMTMSLFGCGSGDSAKEQASDTSETTEVAENTDSKDSDTDKGGKDMTFWIFLDPKSTEDPRSVVLSNIVKANTVGILLIIGCIYVWLKESTFPVICCFFF